MRKTIKTASKIIAGIAIGSLCSMATVSAADNYPNRPVKFVVPWPPGDLEDIVTRMIAEQMAKETGKPATVVNKAGGGGVIGANTVAKARADGLTIGSFVVDLITTQIHGGNSPYNASDFEPVGIFLDYPMSFIVKKDAPYNSLAELADYSKTNKVSLGHFGYQALPTAVAFQTADNLGITFSSDAPFDALDCSTLSNGDADIITANTVSVLACLKSDDVKILASMTRDRLVIAPEVPTLAEETGITLTAWNGLFVKKGTPPEIKQRIAEIAQQALKSQKVQEVAESTGAGIYWIGLDSAEKVIKEDFENTRSLLKYLNK